MQIVIGGAFNGKAEWVKDNYEASHPLEWINLRENEAFNLSEAKESILVFQGIEEWTKIYLKDHSIDGAREIFREWIQELLNWEKKKDQHHLILIANDISKGIVPVDKKDRDWRDLTGWFYQDLVEEAERVDEIWYGISRQLK
ncbi:MAG: bifunctional adenosylcobinamide kinase/adenosylcobinamide-phosphate guanylyltransferase [Atopostipes suicloacalis]|nr:bifunctional adenosylcobinamide kinase/adenosylcobinamide-phosphate guanylyltransferase [Atopostipes suicloacalis]